MFLTCCTNRSPSPIRSDLISRPYALAPRSPSPDKALRSVKRGVKGKDQDGTRVRAESMVSGVRQRRRRGRDGALVGLGSESGVVVAVAGDDAPTRARGDTGETKRKGTSVLDRCRNNDTVSGVDVSRGVTKSGRLQRAASTTFLIQTKGKDGTRDVGYDEVGQVVVISAEAVSDDDNDDVDGAERGKRSGEVHQSIVNYTYNRVYSIDRDERPLSRVPPQPITTTPSPSPPTAMPSHVRLHNPPPPKSPTTTSTSPSPSSSHHSTRQCKPAKPLPSSESSPNMPRKRQLRVDEIPFPLRTMSPRPTPKSKPSSTSTSTWLQSSPTLPASPFVPKRRTAESDTNPGRGHMNRPAHANDAKIHGRESSKTPTKPALYPERSTKLLKVQKVEGDWELWRPSDFGLDLTSTAKYGVNSRTRTGEGEGVGDVVEPSISKDRRDWSGSTLVGRTCTKDLFATEGIE